jgi:DNA gyrase/topoisomerase IV subunit A
MLSRIQVGQIVAWFAVISTIVTALCTGTIKIYNIFLKYKAAKDKDEIQEKRISEQQEVLDKHEKTFEEIRDSLAQIKESLNVQKDVNLKQVRHTIVHTCEDALDKGEISINKLKSLEEMFEEYTDIFHGNGYVKTLVSRVRKLPIVGKLDE